MFRKNDTRRNNFIGNTKVKTIFEGSGSRTPEQFMKIVTDRSMSDPNVGLAFSEYLQIMKDPIKILNPLPAEYQAPIIPELLEVPADFPTFSDLERMKFRENMKINSEDRDRKLKIRKLLFDGFTGINKISTEESSQSISDDYIMNPKYKYIPIDWMKDVFKDFGVSNNGNNVESWRWDQLISATQSNDTFTAAYHRLTILASDLGVGVVPPGLIRKILLGNFVNSSLKSAVERCINDNLDLEESHKLLLNAATLQASGNHNKIKEAGNIKKVSKEMEEPSLCPTCVNLGKPHYFCRHSKAECYINNPELKHAAKEQRSKAPVKVGFADPKTDRSGNAKHKKSESRRVQSGANVRSGYESDDQSDNESENNEFEHLIQAIHSRNAHCVRHANAVKSSIRKVCESTPVVDTVEQLEGAVHTETSGEQPINSLLPFESTAIFLGDGAVPPGAAVSQHNFGLTHAQESMTVSPLVSAQHLLPTRDYVTPHWHFTDEVIDVPPEDDPYNYREYKTPRVNPKVFDKDLSATLPLYRRFRNEYGAMVTELVSSPGIPIPVIPFITSETINAVNVVDADEYLRACVNAEEGYDSDGIPVLVAEIDSDSEIEIDEETFNERMVSEPLRVADHGQRGEAVQLALPGERPTDMPLLNIDNPTMSIGSSYIMTEEQHQEVYGLSPTLGLSTTSNVSVLPTPDLVTLDSGAMEHVIDSGRIGDILSIRRDPAHRLMATMTDLLQRMMVSNSENVSEHVPITLVELETTRLLLDEVSELWGLSETNAGQGSVVLDNTAIVALNNLNSIYPSLPSNIPSILTTIQRRILVIKHRKRSTLATLDSGAMEHVTQSIENLSSVSDVYTKNQPCHISLFNASNTEMEISARGDMSDSIREVLVSHDCDGTLMSAIKFQADGLGIWLPPHTQSFKGGIVYKPCGNGEAQIIAITDKNMQYDIQDRHNLKIRIPDFSPLAKASRLLALRVKVNIVTGIARMKMDVASRVKFAQKTYVCSFIVMLWAAINWPGFPVDEYEVRKYFCRDLAFAMGHSSRANTSNRLRHDTTIEDAIDDLMDPELPTSNVPVPHAHTCVLDRTLYPKKLIPFNTIYSDIYMGAGGMHIATYDDAASGYSRDSNLMLEGKSTSKKSFLPETTTEYLGFLSRHGKHSTAFDAPVAHMVSDSEIIYKSSKMNDVRTANGIVPEYSPPYHKQYSPAEIQIQIKANMVASMAAHARHMNEAFYPSQWHYGNELRNDRMSRVPGHVHISRVEELTGHKTDLSCCIRLPHGQPVMCHIDKDERKHRADRMFAGSYLGSAAHSPTDGTPGAIMVYSHDTRRVCTVEAFEIVAEDLGPTTEMPRKFFTTDARDMTHPYLLANRRNTREKSRRLQAGGNNNPMDHLLPIPVPMMPPANAITDTPALFANINATIDSVSAIDIPVLHAVQEITPMPITPSPYRIQHKDGLISDMFIGANIRHVPALKSASRLSNARQITSITQLLSVSASRSLLSTRSSSRLAQLPRAEYNESILADETHILDPSSATRRLVAFNSDRLVIAQSSIPHAGHGVFAKGGRFKANEIIADYLGTEFTYTDDRVPHPSDFPDSDAQYFIPKHRLMIIGNKATSYGPLVNDPRNEAQCNAKFCIRGTRVFIIARNFPIEDGDEILASYAADDEYFNNFSPVSDSSTSSKSETDSDNDNNYTREHNSTSAQCRSIQRCGKQKRFDQRVLKRMLKKQLLDEEILLATQSPDEQQKSIEFNKTKLRSKVAVHTVGNQRVRIKKIVPIKKRRNDKKEIEDLIHVLDNPTVEAAMLRSDAKCFVIAMEKQMTHLKRLLRKAGVKNRNFDSPTLNEAKKRGDWLLWSQAIQEEFQQMINDNVHGPAIMGQLPRGANLIGTMWVLKIKRNSSTGEIEKYKARLVALGNQQKESSFDQIKSITARGSTVKMIIALQAKTGASSMVLDVKGAYLKSCIQEGSGENLYIRYPDGNIHKLNKYLYGLKQAGFEWQKNVTGCLLGYGYVQSEADPMVFTKRVGEEFCIMCLHVDDFYVISSKETMLQELHHQLSEAYGTVSIKTDNIMAYLGMEVKITSNGDIVISQPAYIKAITELYNIGGKTVKTPMCVNRIVRVGDEIRIDQNQYLTLVGALSHIAQYTRPDILFAVSAAAQKCSKPNAGDLRAVNRIYQYLTCTLDLGIRYSAGGSMELVGSVDASHNQYEDGRGHFGYSFSLGRGNGSFDAKSTKMKLNTLSSTESEYVAFCEATREVIWLRRLLSDMGFPQTGPTIIYEDNTSTIQMLQGAYNHKASKHVNPRYHFSKSAIIDGHVGVEHLVTTEMESDMLTKALPTQSHWRFTKKVLNGFNSIYDEFLT